MRNSFTGVGCWNCGKILASAMIDSLGRHLHDNTAGQSSWKWQSCLIFGCILSIYHYIPLYYITYYIPTMFETMSPLCCQSFSEPNRTMTNIFNAPHVTEPGSHEILESLLYVKLPEVQHMKTCANKTNICVSFLLQWYATVMLLYISLKFLRYGIL